MRVVYHGSEEAVAAAEASNLQAKRNAKRTELQEAIGLTAIMRAVSASGRPICDH